ncbi:hypothetical protein IAU60_000106 [Kwoniella sp. DSM 27419]
MPDSNPDYCKDTGGVVHRLFANGLEYAESMFSPSTDLLTDIGDDIDDDVPYGIGDGTGVMKEVEPLIYGGAPKATGFMASPDTRVDIPGLGSNEVAKMTVLVGTDFREENCGHDITNEYFVQHKDGENMRGLAIGLASWDRPSVLSHAEKLASTGIWRGILTCSSTCCRMLTARTGIITCKLDPESPDPNLLRWIPGHPSYGTESTAWRSEDEDQQAVLTGHVKRLLEITEKGPSATAYESVWALRLACCLLRRSGLYEDEEEEQVKDAEDTERAESAEPAGSEGVRIVPYDLG